MLSTSISGNDINIRLFKRGDLESLIDLYQQVWPNRGIDENYWNWKFRDNPFGKPLLLVAVKGEKIIGHEGLWPQPLLIEGKEQLGYQSVDSMVHPEFRGRGIFNHLIARSMEECSKSSSSIVFGFPNRSSFKTYTKFGWLEDKPFSRFIKVLNWRDVFISRINNKYLKPAGNLVGIAVNAFTERLSLDKKIRGVEIRPEPQPLKQYQDLWLEFYELSGKPLAINKNLEYLNWRFRDKPNGNYFFFSLQYKNSLLGFAIIKKESKGMMKRARLGEFVLLDNSLTINFLYEIMEFLKGKECSTFEYKVWNNEELEKMLKSMGFIKRPEEPPFIYKLYNLFPRDKINWYLSSGDDESF